MEVFKNRKWVVFILSAFLLFDLSVNAVQYYNQPFDSDIVESVLPLPYMEPLYGITNGFAESIQS